VLVAVLLLAAGLVFGGWWYIRDAGRMARIFELMLTRALGGRVEIEAAHASLRGPIRLTGFRLRVPDMGAVAGTQADLHADTIFQADEILIAHDPRSLWRLRVRPRVVSFVNPTLHLVEHLDSGKFNFQLLMTAMQRDATPPHDLPEIYLGRATAVFGKVEGGRYEQVDSVELTGNLLLDETRRGTYALTLVHHAADEPAPGATLEGWFDTHSLQARGRLERFGPRSPLLNVLPQRVRQWWQLLEPTGTVTPVTFGYDPRPDGGFFGRVSVADFELTLPYGEYASRMTNVHGTFELRGETITLTDLRGSIETIDYRINGRVLGFDPEKAPFDFDVEVVGSIPEQPGYLFAMPPQVQRMFARFTPSGRFDAAVSFDRYEPGGELAYEGRIQLHEVKGRYDKFPYPVSDVNAALSFDRQVLRVENFTGRGPDAARIEASGTISPLQDGAAVAIDVICRDMRLDEDLFAAMTPIQRELCEMFLDAPSWRMLVDAGLIRSASSESTEPRLDRADDAPTVFDMGGRIHATVKVRRPYGLDKRFETVTEVDLTGAQGIFRNWPYPMRVRTGRLVIRPQEALVEQVVLESLSGAAVRVEGRVQTPDDRVGRKLEVDVNLDVTDLVIDDLLLASVREPQDRWLRDLHVDGLLEGGGRVFVNDEGRIDYRLHFTMRDGTARPYGGGYAIADLGGQAALYRDGIELLAVTGHRDDSVIRVSGKVEWPADQPHLALTLACSGLRFEDPVLDLLPPGHAALPRLHELFAAHEPRGTFDARIDFHDVPAGASDYLLEIEPADLRFVLRGQDIALTGMEGRLLIDPEAIRVQDMRALLPDGSLRADAVMIVGPDTLLETQFDVSGAGIGPDVRAVLPEGVLRALDGLELAGRYAMKGATLRWRPGATTQPVLAFQAAIDLEDATAQAGVAVTDMTGQLHVQVALMPGQTLPAVHLRLDAPQLRAAERLIHQVQLAATNPPPYDTLMIDDLRGLCYGGVVTGHGQIVLVDDHAFRFSLSLQDAAYSPFITPAEEGQWLRRHAIQEAVDGPVLRRASGSALLSASLDVEGVPGRPGDRLGRGELWIRDAHLVRTPLAMALLHIVNLNFPGSQGFDRVAASFLIEGDIVHIDRFSLEAPTVEMVGNGRMRYSDQALDLHLYSRNPAGLNLGPLTELFNLFKDELLSVHVTGTLDQPQTDTRMLTGVSGTLEDIFGRRRRPPASPVVGEAH
jgi:hypothetical protein